MGSDGMGRPRHCMVVHAYYPVGETRVQREVDALVAVGYEVDVLCLRDRGEPRREREGVVTIRRLPVRRHRGTGLVVQALEYLAFFLAVLVTLTLLHHRRPYDTVQVHNLPDVLVFAAVAVKRSGSPVILDLHDLMPEFLASRTGLPMRHPAVRLLVWLEQRSCRFADHVITVTDGWRDTLIDRGVPPAKATVVMNLADPRVFGGVVRSSRATARGERLELLYHGTITHRYGLDLLLEALATVTRDAVPVHLTVHGHGDALDDLRGLADDLALDDAVTFSTELLPTEELPRLIARADVGVVPYRSDVFTDGILPTKLLEYVATGVPAIVSSTPATRCYFDDTMVRFVTPGSSDDLAAAIRDLHGDADARTALADDARAFERRHDWETTAAAYADLVHRLGRTTQLPIEVSAHVPGGGHT
jgi:glycosyltransferase involved in cell wall biosynthesis